MIRTSPAPAIGAMTYFALMSLAAMYFAFASVQGDFGLFRRVQIEAEQDGLRAEEARLQTEIEALQNKTRRLSDEFLDLELLDSRAREVLGMIRPDEMVLR